MYNQIDANKRKSFFIIALFFGIMLALGWVFNWYFNSYIFLPLALIISIIQAYVAYYHGDAIALAVSHAKPVTRAEATDLYRVVENLTIAAGLPMPKIYLIEDSAMNAFATGRDPGHASIAVTTGLIDRLENDELEGVIAHELSHVGNRDILVMSIVMVLVGAIAMISDFFLRSMFYGRRSSRDDNGGGYMIIIGIILAILTPLIGTLLQLAVSRKREYLADAAGALLTRYPAGLANALAKIAKDTEPLEVANKATAMLYIENPLAKHVGLLNNLFSTHPPVEDRIRRLRQMA